jgi:hypothetical protein
LKAKTPSKTALSVRKRDVKTENHPDEIPNRFGGGHISRIQVSQKFLHHRKRWSFAYSGAIVNKAKAGMDELPVIGAFAQTAVSRDLKVFADVLRGNFFINAFGFALSSRRVF